MSNFLEKEALSEAELKQIALDLSGGKIFCDKHLGEDAQQMFKSVFLPIALGALDYMTKEEKMQIALIYEYLSEAGPRSVNGYPSFFSFKLLRKDEAKKMWEFYKVLQDLKKNFLKNDNQQNTKPV